MTCLKIKNDIDLKELEKFGFINEGGCFYYKLCDDEDLRICVNATMTREISIDAYVDGYTMHTFTDLSVLYDLIQAGFVEPSVDWPDSDQD